MRRILVAALALLTLAGCFPVMRAAPVPTLASTRAPLPTATDTPRPRQTSTPTAGLSATPSATPTLTPTPLEPPVSVTAPVLLYHHVMASKEKNRYFVDPQRFTEQMQALKDWGYTAITVSTLVDGLAGAAALPERPVVITFDDAMLSVYENAFPVMQELGFVGTVYVITDAIGLVSTVDADQLKALAAAGWEIGSHSRTHTAPDNSIYGLRVEMEWTREYLEQTLDVAVTSYAYPFGLAGAYVRGKAEAFGYRAAVGLGILNEHTHSGRYYLTRREVQYEFDLKQFAELLPWREAPE